MAKVGDRVLVRLRGGDPSLGLGPVSSTNVSGVVTIAPGKTMAVPGEIVEDRGDNWLIQLDVSFDGLNTIVVPKSAQRAS